MGEKIESNFMKLLKKTSDDTEYVKEKDLIKHLEWLNWRIAWLEWATNGEKRSFSRPLDAKAVLPSPPPLTNVAPVFSQPITEDVEMWARESNGRMRLRRRMQVPPPNDPGGGGVLKPAQAPPTLSRSHGQLPTLKFQG